MRIIRGAKNSQPGYTYSTEASCWRAAIKRAANYQAEPYKFKLDARKRNSQQLASAKLSSDVGVARSGTPTFEISGFAVAKRRQNPLD
ncbi:MAG: hypothetical protein ABIC04_06970 [Nanoarchaeota archaeon]